MPHDRNDDDHLKASYDIYSDYQDDINERNFYPEHPHQPTSQQQFGFEFARVDENADQGFGQDDLETEWSTFWPISDCGMSEIFVDECHANELSLNLYPCQCNKNTYRHRSYSQCNFQHLCKEILWDDW